MIMEKKTYSHIDMSGNLTAAKQDVERSVSGVHVTDSRSQVLKFP